MFDVLFTCDGLVNVSDVFIGVLEVEELRATPRFWNSY